MSQHDYNIANQGFPNFRSDLNNALGAIATNNSGSTAPTTTFAHQWWLDTSTTPNTLRIRNADNDAWVVVGTVNQTDDTFVFAPAAGSASAPAYSVTGDTNTGIFFPAADTIAFAEGGAEAMRINSSGNVGIGATPTNRFHVADNSASAMIYGLQSGAGDIIALSSGASEKFRITNAGDVGIGSASPPNRLAVTAGNAKGIDILATGGDGTTSQFNIYKRSSDNLILGAINYYKDTIGGSHYMNFLVNESERARITGGGEFLVGRTTDSDNAGVTIDGIGFGRFNRSGGVVQVINRLTNDGDLISFRQASTEEGTISVSGSTVSYNAFAGSHWSQLQQGRGYNPEIPRGTVMSTIGEMCEWKSVVWDEVIEHPAVPAVEAKEAVVDEEGNVIEPAVEAVEGKDAWTETFNKREAYLGNLAVGATFTEDGVTKTVVDDGNERLPKVKISDVVGDKAVYGVFQTWDEAQDMLVTSLGAFVVRIAAGVTVQIGDLLESNGDGCAKVQDDDVIRSRTIGKVTSITPSATYADGSYTVPAVLYCG